MKNLLAGVFLAVTVSMPLVSKANELAGLSVGDAIPGRYIVVLQDADTLATTLGIEKPANGRLLSQTIVNAMGREIADNVTQVYGAAILGFAAALTEAQVKSLATHPLVDSIEPDRVVGISGQQTDATWGLDRSDARSGLDTTYTWTTDGTGVHAYILDTGIRASHEEFAGRIGGGADCAGDTGFFGGFGGCSEGGFFQVGPYSPDDCNGHGTHVAGTVGGSLYGMAKNVTVHAVRVLGCGGVGSSSNTIAGIDWVVTNAIRPAVINMSLGGGASDATDRAVTAAVGADITVVVAAGNDDEDACNSSPARAPAAITIASTDRGDNRSGFSNWGSCVDLFAPGSSIVSASYLSNRGTSTLSGTSMASPHVAGAVAMFLGGGSATPADVRARLISLATPDTVKDVNGSPNLLLFNGGGLPVTEEEQTNGGGDTGGTTDGGTTDGGTTDGGTTDGGTTDGGTTDGGTTGGDEKNPGKGGGKGRKK